MKSFLKWAGIALGSLIGLTLLAGLALYPMGMRKLTQSYSDIQVETINIPTDAEAITRGKHVSIIWACAKCHGVDLSGTLLTNDPILGTVPASNLTSGKGGVGQSYTDTDWIRAIRHGVKPNGRVEIFMYDYYSTMSDRDLGDLIVYLKQIPPVDSEYPAMRIGPIIAIAPAIGLLTPAAELIDHNAPRPADSVPGATIEYGKYLSALCFECHSRNLASKVDEWKQDDFIRALQGGVLPDGKRLGSAMPLKTYGELNDIVRFVIECRHVQAQFDVLDVDAWPTVSVGRRGRLTVMDRARARFSCNTKRLPASAGSFVFFATNDTNLLTLRTAAPARHARVPLSGIQ